MSTSYDHINQTKIEWSSEAFQKRLDLMRPKNANERYLIGIVGEPGAGKSTLASALESMLGPIATRVSMDGFHLANTILEKYETLCRKGAPDTFDAYGFESLIKRIKYQYEEIIYAPEFMRELDESIASAIVIRKNSPIIIIEGNYLLLEKNPWSNIQQYLNDTWYIEIDNDVRINQLVKRHETFGMAPNEAREWALNQDKNNAILIRESKFKANIIVQAQQKSVEP